MSHRWFRKKHESIISPREVMMTTMAPSQSHRRQHRATMKFILFCFTILACGTMVSHGFAPPTIQRTRTSSPSTALNVWWFGGTEPTETSMSQGEDSCELVAVRIERTSPNSRNIAGEITVDAPLKDVWAILTDYDQLAVHIPNLVESKIVSPGFSGEPGDGQYKCRLFQRGAQKIIGFEFGASVTMDMAEKVLAGAAHANVDERPLEARMIGFKCVESPFFSEFDGTWKVQEQVNAMGKIESIVSYAVEVRPRGPVPVAALEWRIREDVPTNLRAVKAAALTVGYDGVMAAKRLHHSSARSTKRRSQSNLPSPSSKIQARTRKAVPSPLVTARLATSHLSDWGEDETMAAYLLEDES